MDEEEVDSSFRAVGKKNTSERSRNHKKSRSNGYCKNLTPNDAADHKNSPNNTRKKRQLRNTGANTEKSNSSKHPSSPKGRRRNYKQNCDEYKDPKKTPLKKEKKKSTTRLRENKSQTTPSRTQSLMHSPAPSPHVKRNAKGETPLHIAAMKVSLFMIEFGPNIEESKIVKLKYMYSIFNVR